MKYKNLFYVEKRMKDPDPDSKQNKYLYPSTQLADKVYDYKRICEHSSFYVWLGHSSVFIKINDISLMIDPIFSEYMNVWGFKGPKRFIGPIPKPVNFPKLDAILITHSHRDHLDRKTIVDLDPQTKRYIVPKDTGHILEGFGISREKIVELGWDDSYTLLDTTIYCEPSHHNSHRDLIDKDRSLWCSYVIKNNSRSIFHSGDTAFSEHFQLIKNKFKDIDIAFMECGQYGEPWHDMHMFPEESIKACQLIDAKISIPIHWGAYTLSTHPWYEPKERFDKLAKMSGINYAIPTLYEAITF